ncbi:MAG: LCP family protein [Acidimicrobiia bacterium]|nr:LCP family protein [Acidimicrobiia bacterium]
MSGEPENRDLESLSQLRSTARHPWSVRRVLAVAGIITVVAGLAYGGWFGYQLWADWRDVERVAFDPGEARERLDALSALPASPDQFLDEGPTDFTNEIPPAIPRTDLLETELIDAARSAVTPTTVAPGLPAPPTSPPIGLTGYLLIGSDGTPSAGNADAIFLLVDSGGSKTLVSVPRSLYINNPCTDTPMRLSLLLRGCPGVAGGPDLVALALEDFTGVQIAHFVIIGYSGFPRIVDSLGGIEICSDTARGLNGQIIVPAGCNLLAGAAASFWVTNRAQDEFVNGQWRAVAGDDELSRLQRERVAMFAVYARIGSLGSAGSVASLAQSVSGTFALDSGLSLSGAAKLAWSARGGMRQLSIPVRSELTPDGRSVLYPTQPFSVTFGG